MNSSYLFRICFCCLSIWSFASQRWVPHLSEPGGPFRSHLIFSNTSSHETVIIAIQPYGKDGAVLMKQSLELQPRASIQTTASEFFLEAPVSHFAVDASPAGKVMVAYQSKEASGGLAHVPASDATGQHFAFFPGNWESVWDGVALVNLGPESAEIEAILYDAQGEEQFRQKIYDHVMPFAKEKFLLEDVFPQQPQYQMVLSSNQTLSVTLLRGSRGNNRYLYQTVPLESETTQKADLLFKGGKIFTASDSDLFVESVAVAGGKIIFAGALAQAEKLVGPQTEIVDLAGGMLLPGLHDVHMHPLEASSDNFQFGLRESETNIQRHASRVQQAAARFPNASWLVGFGHSLYTLLDASVSPLAVLDGAVSDRPVIIMEQTSHSMWVNSKALELAGIDAQTPHPQGGWIVKDPATGKPNGILLDNAGDIVLDVAFASATGMLENDYRGLVNLGLPLLARNGLTSICDARAYWKRDNHRVWQRLAREKKLTARVNLGLWAYPHEEDAAQLAMLKSLYAVDPHSLLRINQIKIYSDGITHNATAALLQPYHQEIFPIPGNKGLNYFTEARIEQYIQALEPLGFDFHIHAIGDRGVHEALNAIERGSMGSGRHRLTHLEIVQASDLPRFKRLNVTADCQVAGEFAQPHRWQELGDLLGQERANHQIPIKFLKDAGARLTLSSDWNVSTANPFQGIQYAVTRAPQAISLTQALKAYTSDAAYVMRHEDRVGTLEVGKEADLVLIDRDLYETTPSQISQTRVMRTYLAGKLIYQR